MVCTDARCGGCCRLTCGGLQSAHTVAVSCAAAELGMSSHLLVRGERPAVPVGNHLLARMFATCLHYVPRHVYADREAMFSHYTKQLREELPPDRHVSATPCNESLDVTTGAPKALSPPSCTNDFLSPTSGTLLLLLHLTSICRIACALWSNVANAHPRS